MPPGGHLPARASSGLRRTVTRVPAGDVTSELLDAARSGDPDAFRAIWVALSPGVRRFLHLLNPAEADDLASETWLAVARGIRSYRGDASGLASWVYRIARNRHHDLLRAQRRRPQHAVADPDDHAPPHPDPADLVAAADADTAAVAAVRRLPPGQAEAVLLRVVVGLSVDEAAQVLGRRPGTVRVLTHRGLRRLAADPQLADLPGRDVTPDSDRTP